MNSPAIDIADILVLSSSATGLTKGVDLFVGRMPNTPDAVTTVYDTGGQSPQSGYVYLIPTVQIKVRGAKMGYIVPYSLAEDIRDILHGFHNRIINSTKYLSIYAMGDIHNLGDDENDRPVFSINFLIHRGDI